ncbi:MAG: SRPBCC domain-containing protein [Ferruginibacter sp.]
MENAKNTITVETTVNASIEKVWRLWTTPGVEVYWNAPNENWHTTSAESDFKVGGKFLLRMRLKDGSFAFDHAGIYDRIVPQNLIEYTTIDSRKTITTFVANGATTQVIETFEPEEQTPFEEQQKFCQGVLNNFKKYVEQA